MPLPSLQPDATPDADLDRETGAIQSALGVFPIPGETLLLVRGADAAVFLGGLTTNHVKALAEGRLHADLLCGNKGKILHPLEVARLPGGQYVLITEPSDLPRVAAHLEAYHVREDVEIGRLPLGRVELLGPAAAAALAALGLDPRQTVGTYRGGPLIVFESPLAAWPRRVALLPQEHLEAFAGDLLAALPGARRVSPEAAEEARIRAGLPRFGQDYDDGFLPAEAALHDRLSFNKGCYVGQEVHARLHWRGKVNRKLMAVSLPADAAGLTPGAPLHQGGQPVAALTSVARLPVAGTRAAIALVRTQELKGTEGLPALSLTPDGDAVARLRPLVTDLGAGAASAAAGASGAPHAGATAP